MKRLHNTQIREQILKRKLGRIETITADTRDDWGELR